MVHAMTALPNARMTVDEYLAWAEDTPRLVYCGAKLAPTAIESGPC
jgi:hypothetical protein